MAKQKQHPKSRHVPLRTCIACRTKRPKRELIRVVRLANGDIVTDERGKSSGRGAYVCRQRACWLAALKRGAFSRALRTKLSPEDIASLRAYADVMPESIAPDKNDSLGTGDSNKEE